MDAGAVNVVIGDGPAARVVGLLPSERNRRVAERAGARVVDAAELARLPPDAPALVLGPASVSNVAVFGVLGTPEGPVALAAEYGSARALWGRAAEVAPLISEPAAWEGLPVRRLAPTALLDASDRTAARASTRALLRQAGKATDGIVSRNVNRPVSRFFSGIFLALRMTPMQASVINLVIGLACAVCAALTGYWTMVAAGALFQFASAFDGVDGEMARTTLTESPRGAWVDTAVDNATYLACLIGITVGWLREGIGAAGWALALGVVLGVPLTLWALLGFVRRYAPDGSFVFVDRCVERAARDSGGALRLARFLFHALRRDVFSALFFLISLSGLRAAVPIAVAAGLVVAIATFTLRRGALVAAARTLSAERA